MQCPKTSAFFLGLANEALRLLVTLGSFEKIIMEREKIEFEG